MNTEDISQEIFSGLPNDVVYKVLDNVIKYGTTKEAVLTALTCTTSYKDWTYTMKELMKDMPKFVIENNNNNKLCDVQLQLNKSVTASFLNALLDKKISVKFLWNELKPSDALPVTFNLKLMLVCEVTSYKEERNSHKNIMQTLILTNLRSLLGDSCKNALMFVDTTVKQHDIDIPSTIMWGHRYELASV